MGNSTASAAAANTRRRHPRDMPVGWGMLTYEPYTLTDGSGSIPADEIGLLHQRSALRAGEGRCHVLDLPHLPVAVVASHARGVKQPVTAPDVHRILHRVVSACAVEERPVPRAGGVGMLLDDPLRVPPVLTFQDLLLDLLADEAPESRPVVELLPVTAVRAAVCASCSHISSPDGTMHGRGYHGWDVTYVTSFRDNAGYRMCQMQ